MRPPWSLPSVPVRNPRLHVQYQDLGHKLLSHELRFRCEEEHSCPDFGVTPRPRKLSREFKGGVICAPLDAVHNRGHLR